MKKYTLVLFAFTLFITLLGFNVKSASADVLGCSVGDKFSRTTGQPCLSTEKNDCFPGDLFSSLTGQPCSGKQPDDPSVSKFNDLFKSHFKIGARGDGVKALQQFLKDEGYYFGKIDGQYGRITARAVRDFQEDNDITVTISPIACTKEAKLCSDGKTYVGRVPPSCEFSACPNSANSQSPVISGVSGGKISATWGNLQKVKIVDYKGDSLESAISKDGQYLFFNNGYQKPKETTIFYAKKIDDNTFQFLGEVEGIKEAGYYSLAREIDSNSNFYFSSDRIDGKTSKIYRGVFKDGKISEVAMVPVNQKRAWDPATFDGSAIYYTES